MYKKIPIQRDEQGVHATLPKEMVDRLAVDDLQELSAVETEHGILLTRDPGLDKTMRLFERIRKKFDRALRELAS